jgi:hypothetical protein
VVNNLTRISSIYHLSAVEPPPRYSQIQATNALPTKKKDVPAPFNVTGIAQQREFLVDEGLRAIAGHHNIAKRSQEVFVFGGGKRLG